MSKSPNRNSKSEPVLKEIANQVNSIEDRIELVREHCEEHRLDNVSGFGTKYSDEVSAILHSQFGFDGSFLASYIKDGSMVSIFAMGSKISFTGGQKEEERLNKTYL